MKQKLIIRNNLFTACFTFLLIYVTSCKKTEVPNALVANWSIINDSLSVLNVDSSNYIGISGDYYNFKANGTLYIHENLLQYSATYSLVDGNQIDIVHNVGNYIVEHRSYTITNLTVHTVTLSLTGSSLGPAQRQIINLKR